MNISVGWSSSSYSSEGSESPPHSAHHRSHQHLHDQQSCAVTDVPGLQADLMGQPFAHDIACRNQRGNELQVMHELGYGDPAPHITEVQGEEQPPGCSASADAAAAADAVVVSSVAPSVSARQLSEEVLYALPSRDSISPHYTRYESLVYNPSFTASSVPSPPLPLPPSPQAMGPHYSEAPFQLAMLMACEADVPVSVQTSQEEILGDGPTDVGVGYLKKAAQPADPSTPPHLTLQPSVSAQSQSNTFARTESPPPLKKQSNGASAFASAAGGGVPRFDGPPVATKEKDEGVTSVTAEDHFQSLHVPSLNSFTGYTSRGNSSEANVPSGEVGGLSEASENVNGRAYWYAVAATERAEKRSTDDGGASLSSLLLPSRSAPPLPRSVAAAAPLSPSTSEDGGDGNRRSTSAAPSSSSRLPSRSAESAAHSGSASYPRSGEPRIPIDCCGGNAAAHSEECPRSWRGEFERAESVSAADSNYCGDRPPSHAPTMHLYDNGGEGRDSAAADVIDVTEVKDMTWRQGGASTSQYRSCNQSKHLSRSRNSSKVDEVYHADVRRGDEKKERRHPQHERMLQEDRSAEGQLTSSLSSPSSSAASSSVCSVTADPLPHSSSRKENSESAAVSRPNLEKDSDGGFDVHCTRSRLNSSGKAPVEADTTDVPVVSSAATENAEVSSIALTTPADTALSSNTGGVHHDNSCNLNNNLTICAHGGAASVSTGTPDTVDESPPPLPPPPWKGVVPRTVHAGTAGGHVALVSKACSQDPPLAIATTELSDTKHNAACLDNKSSQAHEVLALDQWRSGGTDAESKQLPSTTRVASSSAVPAKVNSSNRLASQNSSNAAIHYAHGENLYKGGVDFVRWVPTSVGRDSDFSAASLTSPRQPREAFRKDSTDLGGVATSTLNNLLEEGGNPDQRAARVVAVPLIPSPHRKPQRSANTSVVLAEVAERRASKPSVPGGVTVSNKNVAVPSATLPVATSGARHRIRFSTITSPQLTRDAKRADRTYAPNHQKNEASAADHKAHRSPYKDALSLSDQRNSVSYSTVSSQAGQRKPVQPVDTWTQQKSGLFLASTASSSRPREQSLSIALGTCRDDDAVVVNVARAEPMKRDSWDRDTRLDLDAALASRSSNVNSLTDEGTRQNRGSCNSADEDVSDLPSVVRAWRPLSAVVNCSDVMSRRPVAEPSSTRVSSVEDTSTHERAQGGAAAAATNCPALSIDVSNSTRRSLMRSVQQTPGSFSTNNNLTEDNLQTHAPGRESSHRISPGYLAVYSPRTLATQVLQARDTLLLSGGGLTPVSYPVYAPSTASYEAPFHTLNSGFAPHAGYASMSPLPSTNPRVGSFLPSRAAVGVNSGSRMMPAIGAAVSFAASTNTLRVHSLPSTQQPTTHASAPPAPPCVRVDLSRTPLQGPAMLGVLSDSYDDTDAVATYAAGAKQGHHSVVGALSRQQGEKVAAIATEPWNLFLDQSNDHAEADITFSTAPQQPLPEKVARRIPFGSVTETAQIDESNPVKGRADQRPLLSAQEQQRFSAALLRTSCAERTRFQSRERSELHGFFQGGGYDPQARHHHHERASQHIPALEELRQMEEEQVQQREQQPTHVGRSTFHTQHRSDAHSSVQQHRLQQQQRSSASLSTVSSTFSTTASPPQPSMLSQPSECRSTSTAKPKRPSTMSTLKGSVYANPYDSGHHDRLVSVAVSNMRHTHVVEQQRLMHEEAFRRRQIVMQEDHIFSIELTELNYRRAVAYVQRAAGTAVVAPPAAAVSQGAVYQENSMRSSFDQGATQQHLVGLSAVRQDQAAMVASLGELSRELDSISL